MPSDPPPFALFVTSFLQRSQFAPDVRVTPVHQMPSTEDSVASFLEIRRELETKKDA